MEIKNKIGHCSYCGHNCEFNYGVESYNQAILNLESYTNYKDVYVYRCRKCGLISTNLSGLDNIWYEKVKDSHEFNDALEYAYLNGLNNELYENHSEGVPANIYDAYTVMMKESDNKELYLRALNRTIELKELMLQKYQLDAENEYEEDELEIFEELEERLYENIDESRDEFIDEVTRDVDSNIYLYLMAIENLCAFEDYDCHKDAKKRFALVKKQINLSEDLLEYFNNLIDNLFDE
jgi:hypothetical protein